MYYAVQAKLDMMAKTTSRAYSARVCNYVCAPPISTDGGGEDLCTSRTKSSLSYLVVYKTGRVSHRKMAEMRAFLCVTIATGRMNVRKTEPQRRNMM